MKKIIHKLFTTKINKTQTYASYYEYLYRTIIILLKNYFVLNMQSYNSYEIYFIMP
jgi:hypothetical protein